MSSQNLTWDHAENAIVVCGHAVYLGGRHVRPPNNAALDQHWCLQPFQKNEGVNYIAHIQKGVFLAAEDEKSLLIFSGGQTRAPHILSEAQGYHDVANLFNFWDKHNVRTRVTTEEFARDSYDNVAFSIARFYECVGRFPNHLTIISWDFKKDRFVHHIKTIQWPLSRFSFVGIGNPVDINTAREAEAKTLQNFKQDASGYSSVQSDLGKKKEARNPYRRQHGYTLSCPTMSNVLNWRRTKQVPMDLVPWHA